MITVRIIYDKLHILFCPLLYLIEIPHGIFRTNKFPIQVIEGYTFVILSKIWLNEVDIFSQERERETDIIQTKTTFSFNIKMTNDIYYDD